MGVVYAAEDVRLGRRVAIKLLSEVTATDPETLERFEREARAASALNHPHICTVHDVGEHEGRPFLVMEYLEGETLSEWIERHDRTPLDEVFRIAIQIADALAAGQEVGIVHRDVTPGNVFVTSRGDAKVLDFGLAKIIGPAETETDSFVEVHTVEQLTVPGTMFGTVAYMSPEQARGEMLDPRTDVFSLGAVTYELATGEQAFGGSTAAIMFDAVLNREPPEPSTIRDDLPPALDAVIARAIEKRRDRRYRNAGELRADLVSVGSGETLTVPPSAASRRSATMTTAVRGLSKGLFARVFELMGGLPDWPIAPLLKACLGDGSSEEVAERAAAVEGERLGSRDPELKYHAATYLALCDERPGAFRLLEAAVDGGYCAYPALDLDPLWQRARDHATFLQLRERAIDCRDEFRQAVETRGLSRES